MQFAIVVLAAGKGTRLKSKRPKVLHETGGKTLLRHVIDSAMQIVPPGDIYVVVGHQAERVKASLDGLGVNFVLQAEQRGTGHAIQQTAEAMASYENLIVLSGDVPLIRPETIANLRDFHLEQAAGMTILTARPENPFGYGRIVRKEAGSCEVRAIVEQSSLTPEQAKIHEINSGIYAFRRGPLFAEIGKLQTKNAQNEFYLTDMAGILAASGAKVVAMEAARAVEVLGANTIEEMMYLDGKFRMEKARKLMASGVTIFRPETTVIDADVTVGADTIIEPFVQLLGNTRIGEDCKIRSYSVLENAVLADRVLVRNGCVISQSEIGPGALIGPYSHLRPESTIGDEAHVGNFVEIKKSRLGKKSKANHLSYIGDAEIGSQVNIGAGVITCNYDGYEKTKTEVGDGVFVGSDSTLVAPITLGAGSYIAAGSCITEDVPADALALGRARQTVKDGWAIRRRQDSQRKAKL